MSDIRNRQKLQFELVDRAMRQAASRWIHPDPLEATCAVGRVSNVIRNPPTWTGCPGVGPLGPVSRRGIGRDGCGSRPVSRVLSGAAIHLRHTSPCACSDLPGSGAGHASSPIGNMLPYLVLLRVGFTLPPVSPPTRCALTAPFHPYPVALRHSPRHCAVSCRASCAGSRRSVFCGTFRGLAPPRRYLAPCPAEPGLSSTSRRDAATARSTPALHSVTPTAPDSSVRDIPREGTGGGTDIAEENDSGGRPARRAAGRSRRRRVLRGRRRGAPTLEKARSSGPPQAPTRAGKARYATGRSDAQRSPPPASPIRPPPVLPRASHPSCHHPLHGTRFLVQ